jgi:alkylation response protein AidB-like acyl-CoA dehydrogenase
MTGSPPAETMEQYRARFRAWLATVPIPPDPADAEAAFAVGRRWQKQLYEGGWIAVDWPAAVGGQGLTPGHALAIYAELIAAGAPLPSTGFRINLEAVGPSIAKFGDAEQRRRLLPRLLSGDDVWCQGFSEPDAGSDLASLRTSASVEDGRFVLNGEKVWTTQAHHADYCAVLARTRPRGDRKQDGISYLVVDLTSPGIEVRRIGQLTGEAEFNQLYFHDVEVPLDNLIGPLHEGWKVALETLGSERAKLVLHRGMQAEAAFQRGVRAIGRHFAAAGAPVPTETVARIGGVAAVVAALTAHCRELSIRLGQDYAPSGRDSVDKLVLTEAEQQVWTLLHDCLGPYALIRGRTVLGLDSDRIIRDFLYSMSWPISGGTLQVQRNIVAERVLGLPRM